MWANEAIAILLENGIPFDVSYILDRRQQNSDQHADNRNDDEQFDDGEGQPVRMSPTPTFSGIVSV